MPDLDRVVRRNTLLLATTLAVNSAVVQLVAAVSSLTFVLVTGVEGPARPRPGDLPHRRRVHRRRRGPRDGSLRPQARARPRLHRRRHGMRGDRARHAHELDRRRRRRLRPHRIVERERAARPHGRRRHVPAAAARARHLVRAVRLRLRRDPRADGLQPALRGQGRRARTASRSRGSRRPASASVDRDDRVSSSAPTRRRSPSSSRRRTSRRAAASSAPLGGDHPPARRSSRRCSPRSRASASWSR